MSVNSSSSVASPTIDQEGINFLRNFNSQFASDRASPDAVAQILRRALSSTTPSESRPFIVTLRQVAKRDDVEFRDGIAELIRIAMHLENGMLRSRALRTNENRVIIRTFKENIVNLLNTARLLRSRSEEPTLVGLCRFHDNIAPNVTSMQTMCARVLAFAATDRMESAQADVATTPFAALQDYLSTFRPLGIQLIEYGSNERANALAYVRNANQRGAIAGRIRGASQQLATLPEFANADGNSRLGQNLLRHMQSRLHAIGNDIIRVNDLDAFTTPMRHAGDLLMQRKYLLDAVSTTASDEERQVAKRAVILMKMKEFLREAAIHVATSTSLSDTDKATANRQLIRMGLMIGMDPTGHFIPDCLQHVSVSDLGTYAEEIERLVSSPWARGWQQALPLRSEIALAITRDAPGAFASSTQMPELDVTVPENISAFQFFSDGAANDTAQAAQSLLHRTPTPRPIQPPSQPTTPQPSSRLPTLAAVTGGVAAAAYSAYGILSTPLVALSTSASSIPIRIAASTIYGTAATGLGTTLGLAVVGGLAAYGAARLGMRLLGR